MPAGRRPANDQDYQEMLGSLARDADHDQFWIFAYGSLIWNPAFDFEEQRIGIAHGWHRTFRLGYDKWFRGSEERPGLMMVLDRGGTCKGVLYRLKKEAVVSSLDRLLRREVHIMPHPFPPRRIKVTTEDGKINAITFVMDRTSSAYINDKSQQDVVRILATAAGPLGSMAEYLRSTVERLETMGLCDHAMWRLQERVAAFLEDVQP